LHRILQSIGYNSIHTLDLPNQNNTKDCQINSISLIEHRVVISKDSDFIDSILISRKPYKLLYIATGNISNTILLNVIKNNISKIDNSFETCRYIELSLDAFIIHH
jgi:predicted nuclease of predicted toxin-antitoxin system